MSNSKWLMGLHHIPYPSTLRFSPNGMMPCVSCEPHLSSMFDLLTYLHVAPLKPLTRCQVSPTTLFASKNVKFLLSRNSTKFDMVASFRETIPTVKSVSSSKIYKYFSFLSKLLFYHFSENSNFLGSYILPSLKGISLSIK